MQILRIISAWYENIQTFIQTFILVFSAVNDDAKTETFPEELSNLQTLFNWYILYKGRAFLKIAKQAERGRT